MEKQRKPRGKAGDKTICLPIDSGVDYEKLVEDETHIPGFREEKK